MQTLTEILELTKEGDVYLGWIEIPLIGNCFVGEIIEPYFTVLPIEREHKTDQGHFVLVGDAEFNPKITIHLVPRSMEVEGHYYRYWKNGSLDKVHFKHSFTIKNYDKSVWESSRIIYIDIVAE